jgi:hypothetical protein
MIPTLIEIQPSKSTPEIKRAIEIIAQNLTSQNILKVAEKLEKNPEKVNKVIPTGLKFV